MTGVGLLRGSSSGKPRRNSKVHAFQEEASGEDEARRVSHNHEACSGKRGQHSPAALGDHMRRVFQRRAIAHERGNSGMLLELVEQVVGTRFVLGKRRDLYYDTN